MTSTPTKPVLSLCLILGDAHVALLPRMLQSFLVRPGGRPAADEVVVGWNGKDDTALWSAIWQLPPMLPGAGRMLSGGHLHQIGADDGWVEVSGGVALPPAPTRTTEKVDVVLELKGCVIKIFSQQWTGDFASARQETFEAASGEWRMYADADDILLSSKDRAAAKSIEAEGGGASAPTVALQDWLQGLSPLVNCITAPYNYLLNDAGEPLVRTRRPRIVRWDGFWAWTGRVHETLRHALGREVHVWNPGIVLEHRPILSAETRSDRNFAIIRANVEELQAKGDPLPQELEYGLACELMDRGEYVEASERFQAAAAAVSDHELKLLYLCQATSCALAEYQYEDASELAKAAVVAAPHRPEGYLVACEVAFAMRMYSYAIRWYEASLDKEHHVASMTENQLDRTVRPVRSAGLAYLRTGQIEKVVRGGREIPGTGALAVAELALAVAPDPLAEKVKREAMEIMAKRTLLRSGEALIEQLLDAGFAGLAQRTFEALAPILGKLDGHRLSEAIRTTIAEHVPEPVAEGSLVAQWFAGAPADAIKVLLPLDACQSLSEAVDQVAAAGAVPPPHPSDESDTLIGTGRGKDLYLCVTDTEDLTPLSRAARVEAVTAPMLARECEKHGDVTDLSLVGEANGRRFLTARVEVRSLATRSCKTVPWSPDVTFWCPTFAEPWGPWRLLRDGMGGSEESVVYLARDLARRGLNVQVFAPLDTGVHRGLHIEEGVRYQPLDALELTRRLSGMVVACRAPEAARVAAFPLEQLYVWHQDATYRTGWTPALASAVQNLWVSEWQRRELHKGFPAGFSAPGLVLGDGIPDSCRNWPVAGDEPRDPLACVYASSPLRGGEHLLDMWPEIAEQVPGATLHFYYGWQTAPLHLPAVKAFRDRVMAMVGTTKTVIWHDRVPQMQLEREMRTKGVLLYPCTFPEGYMIAGVRAAAAGLLPVYRKVAALPEVQYPSRFAVEDTPLDRGGRQEFIDAAVRALQASASGSAEIVAERERQREWAKTRLWSLAGDKLIALHKGRGGF